MQKTKRSSYIFDYIVNVIATSADDFDSSEFYLSEKYIDWALHEPSTARHHFSSIYCDCEHENFPFASG